MTEFFYDSWLIVVAFALAGVIFGLIYDFFRIMRLARAPDISPRGKLYDKIKPKFPIIPKKLKITVGIADDILVFIEDILFWRCAATVEVLFIYQINRGEIRLGFLVFTFLGFAAYNFTLGKLVTLSSKYIIFFCRCLIFWLLYIIIYPIKKALTAAICVLATLFRKINRLLCDKISADRQKKALRYAEKGFGIKL